MRLEKKFTDITLATSVAVLLTWLTFRAGPLLTFDGYHYVTFAKDFSHQWPDRFGNHWPFGWPFAGGLLARTGIPAYPALLFLAAASVVALLAGSATALGERPARWLVLLAIAAAPIVAPQFGGVLTELPFAAALLALAVTLVQWPRRGALWGAAGCAVLALALRYAGLVALAMIALHLLVQWRALRAARRLGEAIAAWVAAAFASVALLAWNVVQSGHASGAGRGNPPGLVALPQELASFGWSAPSALLAGGLRDRIGPTSLTGWSIGAICFAAIGGLCLWAWLQPRSNYSRPLAIVAFGYASGMAVLHCVGDFDALYNARTFMPVLAPLAILAAERLSGQRVLLFAGCGVIIAAGVLAAARGISREIGGDIRPAVAAIRPLLGTKDTIAINDYAMSVSAYFPQATERIAAANWSEPPARRFLVAAGKPTSRDGQGAVVAPEWRELAARLVGTARFHYLIRETSLIVLERATP